MLSSENQLELKRNVIVKAYETYSGAYHLFHWDCLLTLLTQGFPNLQYLRSRTQSSPHCYTVTGRRLLRILNVLQNVSSLMTSSRTLNG